MPSEVLCRVRLVEGWLRPRQSQPGWFLRKKIVRFVCLFVWGCVSLGITHFTLRASALGGHRSLGTSCSQTLSFTLGSLTSRTRIGQSALRHTYVGHHSHACLQHNLGSFSPSRSHRYPLIRAACTIAVTHYLRHSGWSNVEHLVKA
jgi:hypothetical protein